jgi:hypothetical protein
MTLRSIEEGISLMAGSAMAKKKMGRPKTSERQDVSIKFDKKLAGMARMTALSKGVSLAEYISEAARAVIERDFAKEMERLKEDKGS